MKLSNNLL